jgi:hypothetical protein
MHQFSAECVATKDPRKKPPPNLVPGPTMPPLLNGMYSFVGVALLFGTLGIARADHADQALRILRRILLLVGIGAIAVGIEMIVTRERFPLLVDNEAATKQWIAVATEATRRLQFTLVMVLLGGGWTLGLVILALRKVESFVLHARLDLAGRDEAAARRT